MEFEYKWENSIPWLSYHKDEISRWHCPKCGKSRNYDVNSMLDVLGDIGIRSLPDVVSKAVGCLDFAKTGWDRCKMAPLPDRAFQKIEWSPQVKIPRGYYRPLFKVFSGQTTTVDGVSATFASPRHQVGKCSLSLIAPAFSAIHTANSY